MLLDARRSRSLAGIALAALLACIPDKDPPVLTIAIAPTAGEVEPGATLQFTATGNGAARGVDWLVDGRFGGDGTAGTITPAGLFQAPAVSRTPVVVTCRSVEDPEVSASATVTFPAATVTVSPAEADVTLGETRQFTATVTGAVDRSVTWWNADGTGLYRAPTYAGGGYPDQEVRATSNATGAFGTATVHLKIPPPVLTAVTGPAIPGDTVTITGSRLASEATVLFPTAGGQPIPVAGTVLSASQMTAVVPSGTTSGPLSVMIRMYMLEPVRSNEVPFVRAARIRVHADRRDVAAGESVPLRVAWLGAPGPLPLEWSADAGTVQADAYVAPASVPSSTFVHVSACVQGTTVCDGVVLGVHPFVVDPDPALVAGGASLALDAHASGAPAGATWWRLAGGGTVSADGLYTSSAALEDAGTAWLAASAGGVAGAFPVGVRGAVPGLVNRVFEYTDHRAAVLQGAYAEAIGMAGARLYVVAGDPVVLYASRQYHWIDVYDVSDPVRPAWMGAVESATRPAWLFTANGRLYAYSPSDWSAGFDSTLAVYDVSGDLPVLVERSQSAQVPYGHAAFDGLRVFFFDGPAPSSSEVGLRVYRTDGDVPLLAERTTALALPAGATFEAGTAHQDRAYLSYRTDGPVYRVAAYDLSVEPPALLAEADGYAFNLAVAGPLLFADRGGATLVFDRRGDALSLVATFPWGSLLVDADATRAVLQTYQSGLAVVDVTDPSAPRIAGTLLSTIIGGGGRLVGDLLLLTENLGGFAAYDLARPGGLPPVGFLELPQNAYPYPTGGFYGLLVRPPYLYAAGDTWSPGGWIATYDLTTSPPSLVSYDWLTDAGLAVAATDGLLAVGTASGLELHDRSLAFDPLPLSSLPIPTNFLAAEGTLVFVATTGTELAVVDAGIPAAPVEVARLDLGGNPFELKLLSPGVLAIGVATVDRSDGWVAVVDVSTPAAPRVRSVAPLGAPGWGLDLDGATALVATPAGLAVVDLADPDAPIVRSQVALQGIYPYGDQYQPAMACSVAVHGGIAFLGTLDANGMVHGFDVRDPSWPRLVSLSAHADVIAAVVPVLAFHERWGFVGGKIVDASQPRNVVLHGTAPPALQR